MELLLPDEMAEADRRTIAAGTPGMALMERAGQAVADCVATRHVPGHLVVVACGPGNNGGDGFVAARMLRERGIPVKAGLLGRPEVLKGDAAEAAQLWRGDIVPISEQLFANAGVVVDALFGAGLARDLTGDARKTVELMNAARAPVIAVDLPSGIDGASGVVRGAAVHAVQTVTFCRRKPGHLLMPGRAHCGHVTVADIGIADETVAGLGVKTFVNQPDLWCAEFPLPRADAHKYDRGHVVVASGPMHATGAARLAAGAALRAGAGLVTVAAPRAALPALAASLTAVMVREAGGAKGLAKLLTDRRLNAVLLGPGQGVGKPTRDAVIAAASAGRRLVLDADALTSFAGEAARLARGIAAAGSAILTPHEGEFSRLFAGEKAVAAARSKLERARAAAAAMKAVVLLKGPDTVVAAPDGRAAIAENAPSWLATAGSGDVLAGLCAGLLAQSMAAFEAACAAVWLHGEAGRIAGAGMISEDLDPALHRAIGGLIEALKLPPTAGLP